MAIDIDILSESGVTLKYWRIVALQADYGSGIVTVSLAGYPSLDTRLAGKSPSLVVSELFGAPAPIGAMPEDRDIFEPTRAGAYEAVMRLERWRSGRPA